MNYPNHAFATLRGIFLLSSLASLLAGCASNRPPLEPVDKVDLARFMGEWYVIASIPTFLEKGAHNAVESYRLADDGTIATTFSFNAGAFDGPRKVYNPTGFIVDRRSNALWGMRFVWPIKADYRIAYIAPDYSTTIVGRNRRDYVWVMARTPSVTDSEYADLVARVVAMGYDTSELQKVPQRWD